MPKTKRQRAKHYSNTALFALIVVLFSVGAAVPIVQADRFDEQIQNLQGRNKTLSNQATALRVEANGLQETINGLQTQISTLQGQIEVNNAKSKETQVAIEAAEAELERQRELLGENIKVMYLEGQVTTIEMLASSKDLSEFFDKQQYREAVKTKIKNTLDKVTALKVELKLQKEELDALILEQSRLQSQLTNQQNEAARLLSLNQSQRAQMDSELKQNFNQISELRAAQAAENARLFGNGLMMIPDTTGYPWPNVPFPNSIPDPWGMYLRQCVSYTAWRVWKSGRHMPYWGGVGNANQWDDNAYRAGISADGNPRVGDVAIKNAGEYGHAMYVEFVYGDGTILISQYNALWDGRYSQAKINQAGLVFIHF